MASFGLRLGVLLVFAQPVWASANMPPSTNAPPSNWMPNPSLLIGTWHCQATDTKLKLGINSQETFSAAGDYTAKGSMAFTPPLRHTITYDVSGTGRWQLKGRKLYIHKLKVNVVNLTNPAFDNIIDFNEANDDNKAVDDEPSKIMRLTQEVLMFRKHDDSFVTKCLRSAAR